MHHDGYKPTPDSDLPLFFFAGLLWFLSVTPVAMSSKVVLDLIYDSYCVVVSMIFLRLSADRGAPWTFYSWLCIFLSIIGAALGAIIRLQYPTEVEEDTVIVNTTAVAACFIFPVAYFCVAMIVEAMGYTFVGSSEPFMPAGHAGFAFWNPSMEATMSYSWYGKPNVQAIEEQDRGHHPRYVERCLLHSRCHWSGEPILDYIYWLANEHAFLGCFFCHPFHPYSKTERCIVALVTVCLIIFPVSICSLTLGSNLLAPLWTLAVVTGPRNLLRWYIKRTSTRSDELELDFGFDETDQEVLSAYMWQVTVNVVVLSFNSAVCFAACVYIVKSDHDLWKTLLYNSDGVMWAFIMDLAFGIILPKRAVDNEAKERELPLSIGFFGRWCQERDLLADGAKLTYSDLARKAKKLKPMETAPLLEDNAPRGSADCGPVRA